MLFNSIRSALCPFDQIENYIPKQGKILDVGCGHGIFCRLLAKKSPSRKIVGIDPSMHKVNLAKNNANGYINIQYQIGVLKDARGRFDCISVIDVLYLLSPTQKNIFLKRAKKMLKPSGRLVLVEVSSEPQILYNFLKLEEFLMVKIFKFTYSDTRDLYFPQNSDYIKLLKAAGFKRIRFKKIQGLSPYPKHILITGEV